MRLAFVLVAATSGVGLLAYLVLAIIVPERPVGEEEPPTQATLETNLGRDLLGYGLLGLGLFLLAATLGMFPVVNWGRYWPTLLILLGMLLLVSCGRNDAGTQR